MFWKVFTSASSSLRRDKLGVNVKIFNQKKKKSYSRKAIGNGWWLFYSGELLQVVGFYFCAVSAFVSSRTTWFHFLGFSAFWKIFSSLKDPTGSMRKVPEHSGAILSLSPLGIILSSGTRRELFRHTSWLNTIPASKQTSKALTHSLTHLTFISVLRIRLFPSLLWCLLDWLCIKLKQKAGIFTYNKC